MFTTKFTFAADSTSHISLGIGGYYNFGASHQSGNICFRFGMSKRLSSQISTEIQFLLGTYHYFVLNDIEYTGQSNSVANDYNNSLFLKYDLLKTNKSTLQFGVGLNYAFMNRNEPSYNVRASYTKINDTLFQTITWDNNNADFNIHKWSIPIKMEFKYKLNNHLNLSNQIGYFFIPKRLESYGYGFHFNIGISYIL